MLRRPKMEIKQSDWLLESQKWKMNNRNRNMNARNKNEAMRQWIRWVKLSEVLARSSSTLIELVLMWLCRMKPEGAKKDNVKDKCANLRTNIFSRGQTQLQLIKRDVSFCRSD